jgi:5-methylcytosine-specific restriction endonuclease McrA
MTERQQLEFYDTRTAVFSRAGYRCEVCGKPLNLVAHPQLAHRIPQATRFIIRYGKRVIHHELNLAATCSLACNAAVDIRNHSQEIRLLVEKITAALEVAHA